MEFTTSNIWIHFLFKFLLSNQYQCEKTIWDKSLILNYYKSDESVNQYKVSNFHSSSDYGAFFCRNDTKP